MRLVLFRFASVLPILTVFSVLAHAQGTNASHTYLAQTSGSAGKVGFVANVQPRAGVGPPFPTPTGTVTLYNGTTAIGAPTTLVAGSGFTSATFAQIFGTPDPAAAAAASGAVWGDFNEDHIPDLLVYGAVSGSSGSTQEIQVFLGNLNNPPSLPQPPAYTPQAAQQLALPLQTQSGEALAVLDVDVDGHLDLLAGNTVAYGKGDGTFGRVAVLPALASGYSQTYAVDIDGDGKTDIVAVDTPPSTQTPGTVQYAFTVFHNDGGGSFASMGPYPLAPSFSAGSSVFYNIFGLSFADVNGDGRIDVISQSNAVPLGNAAEPAALNVMLNLGTGFSAPKGIDTSAILDEGMISVSFTDLNNDGKQDLVFTYQANTMNNGVAVLLGNGDGTFGPSANYTIGSLLAIGSPLLPLRTDDDVDADGDNDVVLGSGVLLRGNGDGTLIEATPLFTSTVVPGNPPVTYALPGLPIPPGESARGGEVIFINLQLGANAVFIPNLGANATLAPLLAPGAYSFTAHYSGNANYAASVSNTIQVTVAPVGTVVTVASSANPSYIGENVAITATMFSPFSTPTGSVVFSDGATVLGTEQVSNGVATYKGSFSTAGSHSITVAYSGDANYLPTSVTMTQTVDAPLAVGSGGSPTSLTVTSGQSVATEFKVSGSAGFSGDVNFSCTGLPMNAACSFTPASVTVSGTAASTITLTVSTLAATTAEMRDEPLRTATVLACGLPLLSLLMLVPVARGRRLLLCLGFALFVSAVGITGCGGDSSANKTPPGNYTFQVVAKSGSASSAASYTLTVN